MPIGFNPLMGQSRLLDIIDQLLAGSGTSVAADMPDLSQADMSQRVNLSNPAPTNPSPMAGLFQPQTRATDAYLNLLSQFPQRTEPGPGRKVLASLAGLGTAKPLGITGGQVVGFQGGSPEEAFQAEDLVRYRPFYQQLQDWQAKAKPFEAAAVNEKNYNQNMRQLLYDIARTGNQATAIENRKENEAAKRDLDWYRTQIDWYKAQNFDFGYNDKGEAVAKDKRTGEQKVILNPDGTPAKTGDLEKVRMQGEFAQKRAETMANAQMQNTKLRARVKDIPIFTDETGNMFQQDPISKELYQVESGTGPTPLPGTSVKPTAAPSITPSTAPKTIPEGQKPVVTPQGKLTKLGGPDKDKITAQTQAMMEGATMLLPHVTDLRTQAADLDKRGLFGPVMGRIRDLAGKVGTTGDFDVDEKNMKDFANSLNSDPLLNKSTGSPSNDEAVGQFLSNLALMASGMGRVHGGARGGGSIQMIEYMKGIVNGTGTLGMFNGRLNTLDSYLKGYAAGPKKGMPTKEDQEMRARIEKALKKASEKK